MIRMRKLIGGGPGGGSKNRSLGNYKLVLNLVTFALPNIFLNSVLGLDLSTSFLLILTSES